jgi:hypothetical protein
VVFFVALFNTLRRKKSNRTSTNSIGTSYIQQDIFTNSVKNTPLKYQFCAFSIKYFAINTVEKIFDSIFFLKKLHKILSYQGFYLNLTGLPSGAKSQSLQVLSFVKTICENILLNIGSADTICRSAVTIFSPKSIK